MKTLPLKSKSSTIYCLVFLFLAISFNACSNDDDDAIITDSKIKLKSDKTSIEPFENLKVTIDIDLKLLYDVYDSVTWQANGTAYGFWWNEWSNTDSELDIRLTDYKPGKHKAYALGYIDGIVASKDSIEYEVTNPKGDFLCFTWHNKKDRFLYYKTGTTPNQFLPSPAGRVTIGGVSLNLSHRVENVATEYAKLNFMPWAASTNMYKTKTSATPNINDFEWYDRSNEGYGARCEMEYEFHHAYLTEIYGKSAFEYKGEYVYQTDLIEEYNSMFKYKMESNYYPIEIWITPTSYICLARVSNYPSGGYPNQISIVIAEPRIK